ncbi:hypothetical protein OIU77_001543 [Salix suchowensis]|uniref:Uncharacterized protein n=1 Tax=Salix suchowensis TaxID=1278906 RepID=A0ABQ9B3P2_9ROSI|nr:hypothetical protein OIU77_001543 [Salix suchowensis]
MEVIMLLGPGRSTGCPSFHGLALLATLLACCGRSVSGVPFPWKFDTVNCKSALLYWDQLGDSDAAASPVAGSLQVTRSFSGKAFQTDLSPCKEHSSHQRWRIIC